MWKDRAAAGTHPFQFTVNHDVERVVTGLRSYDRDAWAEAFSAAAAPYRTAAEDAEHAGEAAAAQRNYLRAYGYYRLARYPTTNSEAARLGLKLAAQTAAMSRLNRAARSLVAIVTRSAIDTRGPNGSHLRGEVPMNNEPPR